MSSPTGTVTLVFTDIQGSTELWERLGIAFQPILDLHNRIFREAIAAHGGYEVKTAGDAFMVAFQHADQALSFALEVQEQLLRADWPDQLLADIHATATADGLFRGLRVRMGIHTGEPICDMDSSSGRMDYFGPMVNRAARATSAAHGGQILLTADHGNAEDMIDEKTGEILTEHTTNPVLLVLIAKGNKGIRLKKGRLADVAPTLLKLMNIEKPKEMTGRILIL